MHMKELANGPIPPFWGFSNFTPTIPKLYWDVKSQEQRILNLFDLLDKVVDYCNQMGLQINVNKADIDQLRKDFEELKDGKFWDYYEQQITAWVEANMPEIMAKAAKMVYFGLTDDGYFCAYIPDSWEDITFDTGMNYGTYTYGRLIIRMDVDGSGVIDNTGYGEYGDPQPYEELKSQIAKLNETVYTALTAKG